MKLIQKKDYYRLIEPLKRVTINNLFARSVIEHCVLGKVYVDNFDDPRTYYVVHPYGMSLLFGDCNDIEFNENFLDYSLNINQYRNKHEWMQAFPNNWDSVLKDLFKDCSIISSDNIERKENGIIELNTRINFKFNRYKFINFKQENMASDFKIVSSEKQIFQEIIGSVVPSSFWDSADDFFENGVGFSLFYKNELASTAFSAFVHDDKLEFGVETVEEFRGKGFAQYVCSALIDYCIENDYEPVWACRIENSGSIKLAQKIGFEPTIEIPYYRLSN